MDPAVLINNSNKEADADVRKCGANIKGPDLCGESAIKIRLFLDGISITRKFQIVV